MESNANDQPSAISQMRPDEVRELLAELGVDASNEQAEAIQRMVAQLGSLEAVLAMVDRADASDAA